MERDGSCRNVISKLINFLPHDTEGQEKNRACWNNYNHWKILDTVFDLNFIFIFLTLTLTRHTYLNTKP